MRRAGLVAVDGDDHPLGHAARVPYALEGALQVIPVGRRVALHALSPRVNLTWLMES